jgi:hypothetical protein
VRVNFLYFKVFKWGKLIWGSDGDFRFHFLGIKNQNLKTHVTKEKSWEEEKDNYSRNCGFFISSSNIN